MQKIKHICIYIIVFLLLSPFFIPFSICLASLDSDSLYVWSTAIDTPVSSSISSDEPVSTSTTPTEIKTR